MALTLALAGGPDDRTVQIPVAAHTLHPGTKIDRRDIELTTYLPQYVPKDVAITDPVEAEGRVVRETIYTGELLRKERLTDQDAPAGLPGVVPRGMQLLRLEPTLPTPAVSPGSYVDVLDGTRFCVAVEAAIVLGVEGEDGAIETAVAPKHPVAWHLALVPSQAQELLSLSSYTLAIRHETDVATVPGVGCNRSERGIETPVLRERPRSR